MLDKLAAMSLAALIATASAVALAAGGHSGGHQNAYGEPAAAAQATRTITVIMRDNNYEPERITVKAGEVIKFVIRNEGELLHEFAIGRRADHMAHQKMMAMMLDHGMITTTSIDPEKMKMDHGGMSMSHAHGPESGSVLVEPGKSAELVWKFRQADRLEFACTVPGHYEAGMVGRINFGK